MTSFCAPCVNRSRLIDRLCRLIRDVDCIVLRYVSLIIFTLINYTTILKKIIAASRFSSEVNILNRVLKRNGHSLHMSINKIFIYNSWRQERCYIYKCVSLHPSMQPCTRVTSSKVATPSRDFSARSCASPILNSLAHQSTVRFYGYVY